MNFQEYSSYGFLKKQNLVVDSLESKQEHLNAKNKNVIVIGGGDTGSDCISTSVRQGQNPSQILKLCLSPQKQGQREHMAWPFTLKSSSSHDGEAIGNGL